MKTIKKHTSGYTIVEVLVFLSVSGFLLLSALTIMSGRQAQIQYRQGVTDIDDTITAVINDVSSGFFPSLDFNCTLNTFTDRLDITAPSTEAQGSRQDCVFLGKAISLENTSTDRLVISTLAGRRAELGEVLSLTDPGSSITPINVLGANLDSIKNTTWGIEIINMYRESNPTESIRYIAYLTEQGSIYSGSLESGNQPVGLYASPNALPAPNLATSTVITAPDRVPRTDHVVICLSSDSVAQNAVIILGRDGRQTSVLAERDVVDADYPECGF